MMKSYVLNDSETLNLCVSPEKAYSFADGEKSKGAELSNPFYDFIEPSLISLIITDYGSTAIYQNSDF